MQRVRPDHLEVLVLLETLEQWEQQVLQDLLVCVVILDTLEEPVI